MQKNKINKKKIHLYLKFKFIWAALFLFVCLLFCFAKSGNPEGRRVGQGGCVKQRALLVAQEAGRAGLDLSMAERRTSAVGKWSAWGRDFKPAGQPVDRGSNGVSINGSLHTRSRPNRALEPTRVLTSVILVGSSSSGT